MKKLALIAAWMVPFFLIADYQDDVGFTELETELGATLPTGAGVVVTQVEAAIDPDGNDWRVNTGLAEFSGKTFYTESPVTGNFSAHANSVGQILYGNSISMTPGITEIHQFKQTDWLENALKTGTSNAPAAALADVQNHSWIGTYTTNAANTDALMRFDYQIQRDNVVSVVGVPNFSNQTGQVLLWNAHNAIAVGLSDGSHNAPDTTTNGTGRSKPDIVAPAGPNYANGQFTSFSTPVVGSAASLLIETARNQSIPDAQEALMIKGFVLGGATKSDLAGWSQTSSDPLDDTFGVGELNVFNSYQILTAGQQEASEIVDVDNIGWDFGSAALDGKFYTFEVPADKILEEFAITLTWFAEVVDTQNGPNFAPASTLADMLLNLYDDSNNLIASSDSAVDNVELIYLSQLGEGRYTIEVGSDTGGQEYALTWFGNEVPEPATVALLFGIVALAVAWRRKR